MALESTSSDSYVRTGESSEFGLTRFFTKAADWSSFIPIPGLNTVLTGFFGGLGTLTDVLYNLVRLRPMSAATAWAAGAASTATNMAVSAGAIFNPIWWADVAQGVVTGRAAGTHARKAVEMAVGGVTGALGVKPDVLSSYTAGIGSMYAGAAPQQAGPGYWASRASQERGQDANAQYAQYMNGDGRDHIAALEAARTQQTMANGRT